MTREKLRQGLKKADAQTREDLDKARDQLHHALNQSESDADKARDRLREKNERDDSISRRQSSVNVEIGSPLDLFAGRIGGRHFEPIRPSREGIHRQACRRCF